MPRAQLEKFLLSLPVKERMALVRRARLKKLNVDDILCLLTPQKNVHLDAPSANARNDDCSPPKDVHLNDPGTFVRDSVVKQRGKTTLKNRSPSSPVNNFPSYDHYDGGIADAVTLEVFRLRQRNAELQSKVNTLNDKLSRVYEVLTSLKRFFDLWVREGQGETYDQIHARMNRIKTAIELIDDRNIGEPVQIEIPARWKRHE